MQTLAGCWRNCRSGWRRYCQVRIEREGPLRRQVRSISVQLGAQFFECRRLPGGALDAYCARELRGILTRPRKVTLEQWGNGLEQALAAEVRRTEDTRQALNRLID
jgi:hypothetical protein